MTNIEKFISVKKILDISSTSIAKILEINKTNITHWEKSNRLKTLHIYAFCKAFEIPLEIFTNNSINSHQKIADYITQTKENSMLYNNSQKLIQKLQNEWFIYIYSSEIDNKFILEIKCTINENYQVCLSVEQTDYQGKIYILQDQSLIIVNNIELEHKIYITFENNKIDTLFFSCLKYKNNLLTASVINIALFSKESLSQEKIEDLLGNIGNNKIIIDDNMIRKSFKYMDKSKILF